MFGVIPFNTEALSIQPCLSDTEGSLTERNLLLLACNKA